MTNNRNYRMLQRCLPKLARFRRWILAACQLQAVVDDMKKTKVNSTPEQRRDAKVDLIGNRVGLLRWLFQLHTKHGDSEPWSVTTDSKVFH